MNTCVDDVELAIIIPAFKKEFLKDSLESIAAQTNKGFNLYLGDDGSPYDLRSIVEEYAGKLNITFHRFEQNLGSNNLVGHWNRCLSLLNNEQWVWMFSDDDIMDTTCVERFYAQKASHPNSLLFHFNVTRIDSYGRLILEERTFPLKLKGRAFVNMLLKLQINSYVVEYIFNKEHFSKNGGFEEFDLAWGSDHATWIKLSFDSHIITIPGAKVKWRKSALNISGDNLNQSLSLRKRNADFMFYKWMIEYYNKRATQLPCTLLTRSIWFLQGLKVHMKSTGFRSVISWINEFAIYHASFWVKWFCYCYLSLYFICWKITRIGNNVFIFRSKPSN